MIADSKTRNSLQKFFDKQRCWSQNQIKSCISWKIIRVIWQAVGFHGQNYEGGLRGGSQLLIVFALTCDRPFVKVDQVCSDLMLWGLQVKITCSTGQSEVEQLKNVMNFESMQL